MRKTKNISIALLLALIMLLQTVTAFASKVSPIVYEVAEDGTVTSYAYVRDLGGEATNLITAVYNSDGSFATASKGEEVTDSGYLKTAVKPDEGQSVKSFLWATDDNTPYVKPGVYTDDIDINDIAITLNGMPLSAYVDEEIAFGGVYDINFYEKSLPIPEVSASSKDSQVECSVEGASLNNSVIVTFKKGARAVSENSSDFTVGDYSYTAERYTKPVEKKITLRFTQDYITSDDIVPTRTLYPFEVTSQSPYGYKKLYELADGETVKTVSLNLPTVYAQESFIVIEPKDKTTDNDALVTSSGGAITWSRPTVTAEAFDYSAYSATYGEATNSADVVSLGMAHRKLHKGDGKRVNGSATTSSDYTLPRIGGREIYEFGNDELIGCNYIVFPSSTTARQITFYLGEDAYVHVISKGAITVSDITSTGNVAWDASAAYTAGFKTRYQSPVSAFALAYLIKTGKIKADDIVTAANATIMYNPVTGEAFTVNGYRLKGCYDAVNDMIKESGASGGWGLKSPETTPFADYYTNSAYTYTNYTNKWSTDKYAVDVEGTPLVESLTQIKYGTMPDTQNVQSIAFPDKSAYFNRGGETASELTGTIESYPDGFGLEDATFISFSPDWVNGSGEYVDTYKNKDVCSDWYTFDVARDAEVIIFATHDMQFPTDDGFTEAVLGADDGINIIQLASANNYMKYRYVYTKFFDAGSTVTMKTPKSNGFYFVFVKEASEGSTDLSLKSISVDGVEIADFDPAVTEYSVNIPVYQVSAPVITTVPANAVVTNPTTFPGSATVSAFDKNGNIVEYTINYVNNDAKTTNVAANDKAVKNADGEVVRSVQLRNNLQVGVPCWNDRLTNANMTMKAVDSSLAGEDYIIGNLVWSQESLLEPISSYWAAKTGDYASELIEDWVSFDLNRSATVKVIYEIDEYHKADHIAVLTNNGFTKTTNSEGYLKPYVTSERTYTKMLSKHIDVTGDTPVTVNIPNLGATRSYACFSYVIVIDYDDYN